MADLVGWIFHSPRRLLLVAVGLLVLVIAAGAVVRAVLPQGTAGAPATRSTAAPALADSAAAVNAAVGFTRAWASKPATMSAAQWRASLQPLVTPELGRLLDQTDPAALPGGGPTGQPALRFVSVASALVEVPLSSGKPVLVTVVLLNARWLVSDVQPAVGDVGDVSPGAAAAGAG